MTSSPYQELGGEPTLRRIVDRFVDRMVSDIMIGFFFRSVDKERLKQKEFEFAARHLGACIEYTGRPLESAHRIHGILDGQFQRRLTLLRETLEEFQVPLRVQDAWISHTRSLEHQVVAGPCQPQTASSQTAVSSLGEYTCQSKRSPSTPS